MGVTIKTSGLKELRAVFKIMYPTLLKELNAGLRQIVKEVESDARVIADQQGFTPPGRSGRGVGNLIGQIRSGVNLTRGWIKDTANRNGYYYPRRYEYENGGARAFLHPAVDQNRDKIYASIALVVEQAVSAANDAVP